ncbi:DUF3494 domain-containing protein [Colwellia sp. MB3u-70]|uniref:DUF6701 domain-containing protein n=1 Tax=unclassified Colwellia TaxID=196834 RepID=UPI0015F5C952|nr:MULTISPECIES: DUF6701 domain-containing protein [unclassified Colwellia]MBA6293226.1 DUF3494 domain-containing protein [Colwellia sp. MB3u-8]MBA6307002.1 DUF3494 domain-containing protein [Colwellia sp. MB3u-70]
MTYIKPYLFILLLFVVSNAQAELPPQLPPPLDNLTIYSSAAITMGASSIVGGNIQVEAAATIGASSTVSGHLIAGAAATLGATVTIGGFVKARDAGTIGADSTVAGHFTTGDAATLGATTIDGNIIVGGDLTAGAGILVGTKAVIDGNVRSGAAASTDLGADTIVNGNATAGTALTLGADVVIDGHAQAGSGAIALGVNAAVAGNARAGTSVTLAADATVGGTTTEYSSEAFTDAPKEDIDDQSPQVAAIQADLAAMIAPVANQLLTSMTVSTRLTKGVYHTTALTTTAGITITFDGEGVEGHWLINSDSFVAFGASTVIELVNVTPNSTITWNAGGYISAGASVNLVGTFFAGSYILTGASTTLKGVSDSCGGFFTTTGAVTLGASNLIGTIGCIATPADIPAIHHYEIAHDGQGLTCDDETVLIKACTNESCSELSTESVTLDFLANGDVISSPSFVGSTDVDFNHSLAETLTFSLANATIAATNPLVCDNSNGTSCEMIFSDAGFRFLYGDSNSTTLPNQTAGSVFSETLKLQAVQNSNGVCTGLFTGNTNIDLSQKNLEPNGTSGLSFSIDGKDIAKHSGVTPTELIFGADSIAIIPTPLYHDAGQIRLHANYDLDGVTLFGSSDPFWVSPAELVVSATLGISHLDGATATASPTHAAGESFTLTVSAFNSLGVITPNYSPGTIQLKLERTGPTLTDSVDGDLTYAAASSLATSLNPAFESVTLNNFSSGQSVYTDAQYSEVGLLNLDLQDSNYGNTGIVIDATAINIGRFIPDHFTQTVAEHGAFMAVCDTATATSFAYSGQKDVDNKGTISYVINPVLAITAYNKQGNITQNYSDDYMKLSAANLSITAPTFQTAIDDDNEKLFLTANMTAGILSQNDLTALPDALDNGVLHYQFSNSDNFYYNRDANTQVPPFISDIKFSTASITDDDGVTVETTVDASPEGVEIRFGRLVLQNSFGPETSDLPQPMQIEYFTDDGFIVSSDNNCVSYDSENIKLSTISLDHELTHALEATGNFLAGKTRTIKLAAPGTPNPPDAPRQGKIGVSYEIYDWLKYDWGVDVDGVYNGVYDGVYEDNPSAVASFGQFRGNDRIISWKEVFNQ